MANEAVVTSRKVELRPVNAWRALQTNVAETNTIPQNAFNTFIIQVQRQYQDDHYTIKVTLIELSMHGTQKQLYVKVLKPSSPDNVFLLVENLADISFAIDQAGCLKIMALPMDRNFVFDLNTDLIFAERINIRGYVNFQSVRHVLNTRNLSPAAGFYYRAKKMIK